jgi:hypothetical protein
MAPNFANSRLVTQLGSNRSLGDFDDASELVHSVWASGLAAGAGYCYKRQMRSSRS